MTYRQAGVDIRANDEMVARIGPSVRRTYGPRVVGAVGGFAGLLRLDYNEKLFARNYRQPLLVACADGVGSKLLLAIETEQRIGRRAASGPRGGQRASGAAPSRPPIRSLGIDLVAMNVNDLVTTGAEPLLFLDYIALHRLEPARVAEIVAGIADGCEMAGCALLGGETAEMPDLYAPHHFDLAGFAVGVVERRRLVDPAYVEPGDVVLGLASNGVHSNGFALVRRLLSFSGRRDGGRYRMLGHRDGGRHMRPEGRNARNAAYRLDDIPEGLGRPLVDELLTPTRVYVGPVLSVLRTYRRKRVVKAMAHITGGGLPGNLPRCMPPDCDVVLEKGSWPAPPIFGLLQAQGVAEAEMYRVFNMGIGFAMIVSEPFAASIARQLERLGERVFRIGVVRRGSGRFAWR